MDTVRTITPKLDSGPNGTTETILPQNIDAEQALLGALLMDNDVYDRVSDFLEPERFMRRATAFVATDLDNFCPALARGLPIFTPGINSASVSIRIVLASAPASRTSCAEKPGRLMA